MFESSVFACIVLGAFVPFCLAQYSENPVSAKELSGGSVFNRELNIERGNYILREDLIIERTANLHIEPGVHIKFGPNVGITVRGSIDAQGTKEEKIILSSLGSPIGRKPTSGLRLVDGPSILSGRLQIFHSGKWRSICSNSIRWRREDAEVACRQMGWSGGAWRGWVERSAAPLSRLLLLPNCAGTELTLSECFHAPIQMGGPTCDYHPDVAIECYPQHIPSTVKDHWRGLRFENAKFSKELMQQNTFYVPVSESSLKFVEIRHAGVGRDYNATSAIEIVGVPPKMSSLSITQSAYNGVNVTEPPGPFHVHYSNISSNNGYGIFVNSSTGGVQIEGCSISENAGDGVRYVNHDAALEPRDFAVQSGTELLDLCTVPTTATQTFPLTIALQQSFYSANPKFCKKYFFTRNGYVLTVNFLPIRTDRNASCHMSVYDGVSSNERLLASFDLYNNTKPQSVTSTRNHIFIQFSAKAMTETLGLIKITSGLDKWMDLNVSDSTIAENSGRGIGIDNLRSRLNVLRTSISYNNHVAGVHINNGAGQVNISDSRISFNIGDGVNVSFAGGSTNVSRTSLSSNQGHGIAVWFNQTGNVEYIVFNQSTVVEYSEIFKNIDTGIRVGNFCRDSFVNITGNWFNSSLDSALQVDSCWLERAGTLQLYIGHNRYVNNQRLGIKIKPAINLNALIEFNSFTNHAYGGILIRNDPFEEFNVLPSHVIIRNNEFYDNRGVFVVNIGLSAYSHLQHLLFTWNFVKNNRIKQPFDTGESEVKSLNPRSRVAAPVVISSANTAIFRNIIQNHDSLYEIGVHLQDQSQVINCTYNWLGYSSEEKIFYRLFDRKDRYNLAKIQYLPYLLHSSNPGASTIMAFATFVPEFNPGGGSRLGGEVDGVESLRPGEYLVERDINLRPGGRLTIQPGVTLRFPAGVGIMVNGMLEARGKGPNDILMTLREEPPKEEESTTIVDLPKISSENQPNVRLIGGATANEGTLQVKVGSDWGTVCNYGWTRRAASLVCSQLGLVLNPNDWLLYPSDVPHPGTNDPILLTNVRCDDDDLDVTKCKSERAGDFENACNHMQDVLMRCYPPHWAGMRLGVLADRSHLQYITVEKAGILDYATTQFKPALQIDLARHTLENVRLIDNALDGLGIIYSDIFSMGMSNTIKNCDMSNNRGSGVAFKQLGMKIISSRMENNRVSGLRHDPWITALSQREMAGWFKPPPDLSISPQFSPHIPILIPQNERKIELDEGQTKFIITQRVLSDLIEVNFYIKTTPGLVLGIQLLNPILNRSTEDIKIHDAPDLSTPAEIWNVGRDLTVFPATSTSYGIVLMYSSGIDALGMTVLAVSAFRDSKQHYLRDKLVRGIIPSTTVINSRIKGNSRGIWATHYNRYLTELGDHYLRKANESLALINCDISHNEKEAIYVDSPYWSVEKSNISEISFILNNSLITDNGRGIFHFSRDLRNSTNLFHWLLSDNSIERNSQGGLEVSLPYVWSYNENFTHSIFLRNNTWRNNRNFGLNIGGHFARVNISENLFEENKCKIGLISLQGMEKMLNIRRNTIERNSGSYMIEFKADSQSEILGNVYAVFSYNLVKRNLPLAPQIPSSVILMNGVQKVRVRRNLVSANSQGYSLVAGIKTARLDSSVDVTENWWGSTDPTSISKMIFDFDDWNDHAIAIYSPFLVEDSFEGSVSVTLQIVNKTGELGGRLEDSLRLYKRQDPYQVISDLTIMPGSVLKIDPGVTVEFAPRVGILVLGQLIAKGEKGHEIVMKPSSADSALPLPKYLNSQEMVRLCEKNNNCTGWSGWVERWNSTTQQWVPVCDSRWSERNTEVACRQLGRDSLDTSTAHGRRYDLTPADTSAIWSWHEPLQCTGEESKLEDCEIRLNGQVYGHYHTCSWDSNFVFIDCGQPSKYYNNWGGIRFANKEFEQSDYEHRIHDSETHTTVKSIESHLQFVNITSAGLLHSVRSPAILAVAKTPIIRDVCVKESAHDGISYVSPNQDVSLLFSVVDKSLGVGVSVASLTGEGRESIESSYTPLKTLPIPYWTFSFVDICDPNKEIVVQERVILYYKYDNRPINCVKIFHSAYLIKPFGFRLLQFNLFNSTDRLDLYDGSLYNRSMEWITSIDSTSQGRKFVTSRSPSLSIRLVASAASQSYGFLAEIVTLPISAIGFNRDIQHNVSYSILSENKGGAVEYVSAGEVNPRITLEFNQIVSNCRHLYGNFTTCIAPVYMDLQNTQNLHFRNNLVQYNVGGLNVIADSRGTATALKGWVHNNLFADNTIQPSLSFQSRQSSPYQQVTIYHNYWTRNQALYHNIINLNQVVSNFTFNYLHDNEGSHILEVSGFERVRLPIYQSTSHNGFYWNRAIERDSKSTIVAGTAGQHYVDNIFFNPHNDYEMITVSRSLLDVWQSPIDARHNYWSYNESLAVMGRIRDRSDRPDLLQVDFSQFLTTNESILDGKCPPAWSLVGDTCYIYIGAPMGFFQARHFCRSANASMPYLMGNYGEVYKFLRRQQENFRYWSRVWVQHIDKINMCTAFVFSEVRLDECHHLSPFICEMDPKVIIDALSWKSDVVAVAMLGCVILAIILVALVALFWFSKSRHRHAERLERRNSIRQSLNSVRSIGSVQGFNSMIRGSRIVSSGQSSPTLNKGVDYKKMSGSVDSIEKSQFNSSNEEDTQSYDIYEAHNPTLPNPASLHLSFRNQGFRDNSTLASRDNSAWQSTDDFNPHDTSTLPLASPTFTDSTVDIMKPEYDPEYQVYYERPKSSALLETDVDTSVPSVPPRHAKSEVFLETDFDSPFHKPHDMSTFQPLSKSQPLETAM